MAPGITRKKNRKKQEIKNGKTALSSATNRPLTPSHTLRRTRTAHTMAAASASLLHLATPTPTRSTHLSVRLPTSQLRIATAQPPRAYKVTIEHGGESRVVEVEKD